ncbi:GNAT family N-acetyltransferase [Parvimonas micra]|uniref:GNAT family N-acetyltransferase n=1 Tax=Parvimonas micra TaxID=33033 RepID=UPI0020069DE3|nr:GNAT family N-acetyltransferase [Parvimonas micra]MCK6130646.1 GNAT family N-acetyltransferase [Parvimonas micra]MCK6136291.1 GNAT family N-acetyltransferase [Parvimonas micra]MCK6137762.1 GNAT family N-acetyltransferase [Parvimonas micra]MCK6154290.1 GNAT family N-acetyltransferase [Parvimonas micra]
MEIRRLIDTDAKEFYNCLKIIDSETDFMMFEPDERVWNEEKIVKNLEDENNLFLGAIENGKIVGFLSAQRGAFRRIRHTAYVVIGIQKNYCNRKIGTQLFEMLDDWAIKNGIIRLELTVECENKLAIKLYEKSGFAIEGIKKKTIYINGKYVDEYMMSKIF